MSHIARMMARAAAAAFLFEVLHADAAHACSVCFSEEAGGEPLRWAIGVLLALVVVVQIALARFLYRVMHRERRTPGIAASRGANGPSLDAGPFGSARRLRGLLEEQATVEAAAKEPLKPLRGVE